MLLFFSHHRLSLANLIFSSVGSHKNYILLPAWQTFNYFVMSQYGWKWFNMRASPMFFTVVQDIITLHFGCNHYPLRWVHKSFSKLRNNQLLLQSERCMMHPSTLSHIYITKRKKVPPIVIRMVLDMLDVLGVKMRRGQKRAFGKCPRRGLAT